MKKTTLLSVNDLSAICLHARKLHWINYCAFGSVNCVMNLRSFFNGQLLEPQGREYMLGHGRRSYSPALARFFSPDGFSPFGKGGFNAYSYAMADPINYGDFDGAAPGKLMPGVLVFKGRMKRFKKVLVAESMSSSSSSGKLLNIIAHGDGAGYVGGKYFGKLSPSSLFKMLQAKGVPIGESPVHLLSCRGADTGFFAPVSYAQRLANLSGQPVTAYHGVVTAARSRPAGNAKEFDGFYNVFTHENFRPQTFYPER